MEKITIYTNESCHYCKLAKEELTKNNIKFEEKLIDNYRKEWQNIVNLTGIPITPTISYKNEYFIPGRDYQNNEQLPSLLKTFEKSSYSESKIILEKIKTLNYNINMAFGRLDKLLKQIETKINTDEHKSTD